MIDGWVCKHQAFLKMLDIDRVSIGVEGELNYISVLWDFEVSNNLDFSTIAMSVIIKRVKF